MEEGRDICIRLGEGGRGLIVEKMEITCRACRNECSLEVEYEDGEVLDVAGNGCMKGMIFAQGEVNKLDL